MAYICTTGEDDRSERLQRSFARRLGVESPEELATGHLPMLEDPDALAGKIVAFVDSVPCQCGLNGPTPLSACLLWHAQLA